MKNDLDNTATASAFSNMLADTLTPKVAVSYLRVSTHEQAERGGGAVEGFSIPAQRDANKKKAASPGAFVVKEFVDRGESARSANRPELKKMLEYIDENKNRVDYVIVHKVDRLARNRGDDVDISRALHNAGVKLVSTTESIDESPSGMLLHGIMSSIAEFYSRNLSNEVLKGLSQKAKNGGTNYHAPLGYKNIRTVDDKGREDRTVILDEERAPLIKLAFEYFATGDWTVNDLAEHLAQQGLATLVTPKIPSKPIDRASLNKLLVNPYYKGYVYFQGALYPGKHTPLVDENTWQQVQDVLESHHCGERTRKHPHFLKGTVYCGACGSRLIIQNTKNSHDVIYPYFICSGRHGKRTDCQQKAVLIEEVERQIEKLYERMTISPELRKETEKQLNQRIEESAK
jgi:DNA invertase Pin-like site-specific DNA recombinase